MPPIRQLGTLTALAAACLQAQAVDFKTADGLQAKLSGVVLLGTQIRTQDPSPEAYSAVVSPSVPGVPVGQLAGQNGGPNLNFEKGDAISTVLKAMLELDLQKNGIGLFVRASAWKDFALGERNVRYGNYVNGFVPGTPLGDTGFDRSSRFDNIELRDAFVYGSTQVLDGKRLEGRLGRQVLNWGGARLIGGGIGAAINPLDAASALRPGAQPFEGRLPLGMLSAKLAAGTAWQVEGFWALEHRGNVYPACGTFFDVASFIASGCNMISFAGASEQAHLARGSYVHRNPDVSPGASGHAGLAVGFRLDALAADVKLYAMNTTSVAPSYRMTVNAVTPAGNGGPLATNYGLIYPKNVPVLGLSFTRAFGGELQAYGELAVRPNQPISYNASDLLGAFVAPDARKPGTLLGIARRIQDVPVGGSFDAYERFEVTTGSLGLSRGFAKALGAERLTVTGEIGFSHIAGLPDPSVLRFGRGTAYGAAAYVGANGALTACNAAAVAGKQCTTDGYTSANAWGLRLLANAVYRDVVPGVTLTPSLMVAKDVSGYSYDGSFSEGRTLVRPGLRADFRGGWYGDLQWHRYGGGRYNLLVDRDHVSLVAGLRF